MARYVTHDDLDHLDDLSDLDDALSPYEAFYLTLCAVGFIVIILANFGF